MNTNMAGFRWFSKISASLCLDENCLRLMSILDTTICIALCVNCFSSPYSHMFLFSTSASCAHAKLSLRREVVEEDAVMAILLYEESIMARFGKFVFLISLQSTLHLQKVSYIDINIWQWCIVHFVNM